MKDRVIDFIDRKILFETTTSAGIPISGSPRRNTYKMGDRVRLIYRKKRVDGVVFSPLTSDGRLVIKLTTDPDSEEKLVVADPDKLESV